MPKEDALNYDKLKVALLKRYELTEEGFKRKYKCAGQRMVRHFSNLRPE